MRTYKLSLPFVAEGEKFEGAMLVPLLFYTVYFLVLQFFTPTGVIWTIHLTLGSIVVSALLGLLLTYLIIPPPIRYD